MMQEFGKICENDPESNEQNNQLCSKKKYNKDKSRMGLKQGSELIGCPVIKKWNHPQKLSSSSSSSSHNKLKKRNNNMKQGGETSKEDMKELKWKKHSAKLSAKFSAASMKKIHKFYKEAYADEVKKIKLTNKLTGGSGKGHTILNVDGISLPPSNSIIKLPFQYDNTVEKVIAKKKDNNNSTSSKTGVYSDGDHLTLEETKALMDILLDSDWLDNAKAISMEFSFFSTQFNSLTVVQLVV
jgi:hypothetical protein